MHRQIFFIFHERGEIEIVHQRTRKFHKLRQHKHLGELPRSVRSEVKENAGIAILHCCHRFAAVGKNNGNKLFIIHASRIGLLNRFICGRECDVRLSKRNSAIRRVDAAPAIIPIHGPRASSKRRNASGLELFHFLFQLSDKSLRAVQQRITAI